MTRRLVFGLVTAAVFVFTGRTAVFAQTGGPISIQAEDIPVADAIELIFRQAQTPQKSLEYIFEGGAGKAKTVTVSLSNVSFEEALRTVLSQVGMTYEVDDKGVYRLREGATPAAPAAPTGVLRVEVKKPTDTQKLRLVRIPLKYLDPVDVVAFFGGQVLVPRFTSGFGGNSGAGGRGGGFGGGGQGGGGFGGGQGGGGFGGGGFGGMGGGGFGGGGGGFGGGGGGSGGGGGGFGGGGGGGGRPNGGGGGGPF